MGYIERILGDNERVIYRTHKHWIVLFQRIIGWLLAFLLLLGLGLVMLLWPDEQQGERIRWWIGLAVLCTIVVPVGRMVVAWLQGRRGRDLVRRVWRPSLAGIALLAIGLFVMLQPNVRYSGWIGVALALIPLAETVRIFLDWLNERFLITNRRVMEVRGIVNKNSRDSALEKVNDVGLKQSFIGRIMRYGTIEIITGSDIGVNYFRRIHDPVRFKRAMLNAKESLHQAVPGAFGDDEIAAAAAAPVAAAAVAGATVPAAVDIPNLIEELDELRRRGLLSDKEFEAKKKQLLARM